MTIDELKSYLAKLNALVEDPQPGMLSWMGMLHNNMEGLIGAWRAETYEVVRECTFNTLSPQADAGIIASVGDLVEVQEEMVYVIKNGVRHDTINYPILVERFLDDGYLRKK